MNAHRVLVSAFSSHTNRIDHSKQANMVAPATIFNPRTCAFVLMEASVLNVYLDKVNVRPMAVHQSEYMFT
jgi:hypothetical protein